MSDILSQLNDIEENVRSIKATWGNTIMTLDNIKSGLKADRQKATDEAYQRGLDDAWEAAKKIVISVDKGGLSGNDLLEIFGCESTNYAFRKYSASEVIEKLKSYEEQQKADEIKVGDIITDGKINYLVIDITDKSYVALQGTDFEPSYIGKDYIKSYHNLHDPKDMRKISEEISKAIKSKQRNCSTCKRLRVNSIECTECFSYKGYNRWEPKEGAE